MEVSVKSGTEIKNGDGTRPSGADAPSTDILAKEKLCGGPVKKKRRRGKSKRKVLKPFMKMPWSDRKRNDKSKRNRFRKLVLTKTHAPAPFNNNQFLMEIHKPEQDNDFQIVQTPSARTRDSSFSVDSEENYFYSLPDDEEEFLTKEFSSVYEDAQSERLANMSKTDLVQEYLLLEAKYDTLVKRTERSKLKQSEDNKVNNDSTLTDKDFSTDRESMITDKDTTGTSVELSASEELSIQDYLQRLKEQEEQISLLKIENEKLVAENEYLRKSHCSSSEDSESDSSSTSISCSSSSSASPVHESAEINGNLQLSVENGNQIELNGHSAEEELETNYELVNGYNQNGESDFDEQPTDD